MKKSLLGIIVGTALVVAGCHSTPHGHHDRHDGNKSSYVDARVEMIQQASEVCSENFEMTEDGKVAIGLLAGGLIGSGFGSGAGAVLMTISGAATGAVTTHAKVAGDDHSDSPSFTCRENGYEAKVTYYHPRTKRPVTQWVALDKKVKTSSVRLPLKALMRSHHRSH